MAWALIRGWYKQSGSFEFVLSRVLEQVQEPKTDELCRASLVRSLPFLLGKAGPRLQSEVNHVLVGCLDGRYGNFSALSAIAALSGDSVGVYATGEGLHYLKLTRPAPKEKEGSPFRGRLARGDLQPSVLERLGGLLQDESTELAGAALRALTVLGVRGHGAAVDVLILRPGLPTEETLQCLEYWVGLSDPMSAERRLVGVATGGLQGVMDSHRVTRVRIAAAEKLGALEGSRSEHTLRTIAVDRGEKERVRQAALASFLKRALRRRARSDLLEMVAHSQARTREETAYAAFLIKNEALTSLVLRLLRDDPDRGVREAVRFLATTDKKPAPSSGDSRLKKLMQQLRSPFLPDHRRRDISREILDVVR